MFPYIYICIFGIIIPTDELHHVSEGWRNHQPDTLAGNPPFSVGISQFAMFDDTVVGKSESKDHLKLVGHPRVPVYYIPLISHEPNTQWPFQDPMDWSYLPYIRPIFQGYVRGYTHKI